MVPNLKTKPCLCISLEVGAISIAALEISVNVILACLASVTVSHLAVIHSNNNEEQMKSLAYHITEEHPEILTSTGVSRPEPHFLFVSMYVVLALTILRSVAEILCASMLILGIRQERLSFLRIWLIFKASCITLGILLVLSNFLMGRDSPGNSLCEISNLSTSLIGSYFFYVVYRLYVEIWLRQTNNQRCKPRGSHIPQLSCPEQTS